MVKWQGDRCPISERTLFYSFAMCIRLITPYLHHQDQSAYCVQVRLCTSCSHGPHVRLHHIKPTCTRSSGTRSSYCNQSRFAGKSKKRTLDFFLAFPYAEKKKGWKMPVEWPVEFVMEGIHKLPRVPEVGRRYKRSKEARFGEYSGESENYCCTAFTRVVVSLDVCCCTGSHRSLCHCL